MADAPVRPAVLVVDDEINIRKSIELALTQEGLHVLLAHDAASALRVLQERVVDLVILDIRLGEIDGLTLFNKFRADGVETPTIFISGHATLTEAAEAVKRGGYDFVEKPFSAEKISIVVKRGLEFSALADRLRFVQERVGSTEIVGDSHAIREVVSEALKVAPSRANVLITGESGTGKELVANTIHGHSARSGAPFIKVNCSAIPESLMESELFGYERGAFTGALQPKRGFFELANRGTIFLDEIADLSLPAQAKILRVLQNGEIQKVGSEKIIQVDVRFLSGTHKDLKAEVAAGRFREDLFYRLNVIPIRVPSLRERPSDIPLLAHAFVKILCERNNIREKGLDENVLWELKRYEWPGNVRELQNVLERMVIMSGSRITVSDLPEEILATSDGPATSNRSSALKEFRDKAEREFVIRTLRKSGGIISHAAIELGVGRTYLHKRLSQLGITKKDYFS
ncbi:MAG: sigma-54-dependent transcriptional regulator [Bdellovibrionales bacterium]